MPVHRIDHYNFRLSRELMAKVARFYVEVVGLTVGARPAFSSYGIWLYAQDKDVLHLSEEMSNDKRRVGRDMTFDHVALDCSNWPEHESRLLRAGIEFQIDHVPGTEMRQVFFQDPAGNGVELIFKSSEA